MVLYDSLDGLSRATQCGFTSGIADGRKHLAGAI
jgi:hypothetical protein